jgi:hypothetical protein
MASGLLLIDCDTDQTFAIIEQARKIKGVLHGHAISMSDGIFDIITRIEAKDPAGLEGIQSQILKVKGVYSTSLATINQSF